MMTVIQTFLAGGGFFVTIVGSVYLIGKVVLFIEKRCVAEGTWTNDLYHHGDTNATPKYFPLMVGVYAVVYIAICMMVAGLLYQIGQLIV